MARNKGFNRYVLEFLKETINKDFDSFYGLTDSNFKDRNGDYPNIFKKSTGSGLDFSKLECWELSEYMSEEDEDELLEAYYEMRQAESERGQDEDEDLHLGYEADHKWKIFLELLKESLGNKTKYFTIFSKTDSEIERENIDYILLIE